MTTATVTAPQALHETGIRRSLLEDLALKILFLNGEILLRELSGRMCLNLGVMEEIFQALRKEQLIEVKGLTNGNYRIAATGQGKKRAMDLLSLNQYAGPAPVSLDDYSKRVREQSVQGAEVRPADVRRALAHMVVADDVLHRLGTAVISGTSIFLHGPTGAGKSSIAEALPNIYQDAVWVPHALEVDNQIITIYDSHVHERLDQPGPDECDSRWVLCRRPRVLAGGELTLEMLDLQFNMVAKFYAAPLQLKANNGVLIIDDLGRQRVHPEELLNRWILPLDRHIDFLTLSGGMKFEIPFELFVVFATNLDPSELADEAFLRRMQNKIRIENVSRAQFHQIFQLVCATLSLPYDASVVDRLADVITEELNQPLRACFARDIVRQVCWAARYEGRTPALDRHAVESACRNYFLPPEKAARV